MATTGTPQAKASSTIIGWFSCQREGTATTRAARIISSTRRFGTAPWKRIRPGARLAARASSAPRSGPSPSTSSTAAGWLATASTSTSTPFSAERRPAKTTPSPAPLRTATSAVLAKCRSVRSRSGKTPAARMVLAMKSLGQMNRPTGSYAPDRVCSVSSSASTALAPSEPPSQRRSTALWKRMPTHAVHTSPWSSRR